MAKKTTGSDAATNEKKATGSDAVAGNHYEEWDVRITAKQDENKKTTYEYEKLKVSRPVVKISEEEAEVLNRGVLTGGNTYAKMYFLPETE